MLLLFLVIYLKTSFALLITPENRISTRNITCRHGLPGTINFLFNCEACLITSRNYAIETTLSLTGSGLTGIFYACLQVNEVEMYHENLIRECYYFPRDTLNGYDDFCIASPYNHIRGSYRACICLTNLCNFNYTQCIRQINPYRDRKSSIFSNTIVKLTNRVKCYQPYDDYQQQIYSNVTSLCSNNDDECNNYLYNHGVLCIIRVDRTNQISRQTLIPSIYSAYIIKYKTQFCNSFIWTSTSIYFSQCQFEDIICMCTLDGCNKDLETCRTSKGIYNYYSSIYFLLVFIINLFI